MPENRQEIQSNIGIRKVKIEELALIISGGVLILLNQFSRPSLTPTRSIIAYCLLAIGCGLFLLGAWSLEQNQKPAWLEKFFNRSGEWFKAQPIQVISLLVAFLLSITATNTAGFENKMLDQAVSLLSWVGSIILVVLAGWERRLVSIRSNWRVLVYALALFFVAFALRGINTTHYPFVLSSDEASSGLGSIGFLKNEINNLFNVYWFSFPSLYNFIQSFGIVIFGRTIPGIRLTAALIGSLTVVSLYLIVRAMFDKSTALMAAILLAFSHFHLHFSRLALNNIWDGLAYVVSLGALWWAWKNERKAAFILSGIALGFSQYFYTTGHGVPVIALFWLILVAIQDRKKFIRMVPNLLFMFMAMLVVFLPLAWFYLHRPFEFFAPMDRVTIFSEWLPRMVNETGHPGWRVIVDQFITSLLAFTDRDLVYWYTPAVPILRSVMAIFFYIGVGLMMFKIKDNRIWLIILWLGMFVASGALSDSTPAAQRYVASIPACVIVVAYGLNRSFGLLERAIFNNGKKLTIIALILALGMGIDDARFYFLEYTPRHNFGDFHSHIAQRLANYLEDYDDSWEVVFSGWPEMGYMSVLSLTYLEPQIKGIDLVASWGDPSNPIPDKKNVMFVFLQAREADFLACKEQYPGGEVVTEYNERNELMYYMYKIKFESLPD